MGLTYVPTVYHKNQPKIYPGSLTASFPLKKMTKNPKRKGGSSSSPIIFQGRKMFPTLGVA